MSDYKGEELLIDKLQNLERKDKEITEQTEKYKNMSYYQVLQKPENIKRLKEDETRQEWIFEKIIRKRDELKHLKDDWKDLFAEYYMGFLKGEFVSINDFFYEDCKETDIKSFFEKRKFKLKENFKRRLKDDIKRHGSME